MSSLVLVRSLTNQSVVRSESYLSVQSSRLDTAEGEVKRLSRKTRKRKRGTENDYETLVEVIDRLLELYSIGAKYRSKLFKSRKNDVVDWLYHRRKVTFEEFITPPVTEKGSKLHRSLLEKETIDSMKKMMKAPNILKDVEYVFDEILKRKSKSSKAAVIDDGIYSYLRQFGKVSEDEQEYRWESLPDTVIEEEPWYELVLDAAMDQTQWGKELEFDKEKQETIMRTYKLDQDNVFTPEELRIIKVMKTWSTTNKKQRVKRKTKFANDVWSWREFLNYFVRNPVREDNSSISSDDTSGTDEDKENETVDIKATETAITRHLKRWFLRESLPPIGGHQCSGFHIYEPRKTQTMCFQTNQQRLSAAVRFLQLALLAFPDINVDDIMTQLRPFFGDEDLPTISKSSPPQKTLRRKPDNLRFFENVIGNTEKLKSIFKRKERDLEVEKEDVHRHDLESLLVKYDLGSLYEDFIQTSLPNPYNDLYITLIEGLLKIYQEAYQKKGGVLRKFILDFIREISDLILHSTKWLVQILFHNTSFPENEENEGMSKVKGSGEEGEDSSSTILSRDEIKKEFVRVIKYQNIYQVINHMIHKNKHDILHLSSEESYSEEELSS